MLTLGVTVLGVDDVERAAAFWRDALGYVVRRDGFGGWAVVLEPPPGVAGGGRLALQRSRTPLQDHPRLHLDLHAPSAAAQRTEAARLITLGATPVDWPDYPSDPDFTVLADPDGNRFCIVNLGHPN